MRHLALFISYILCFQSVSAVNAEARDSLIHLLHNTTDPVQRCSIYRNLADISFETPDEKTYLLEMYQEARNIGNREDMMNALIDIVFFHTKELQMDSSYYYMNLIQKTGTKEEVTDWSAYFHIRFFEALCSKGENKETIRKELNFLENYERGDRGVYKRIVDAFITGQSLSSNDMMKEALPYFKMAMEHARKLPFKNGEKYTRVLSSHIARAYGWTNKADSAKCFYEENLKNKLKYFDTYYVKKRPFFNIASHKLQTYGSLMLCELVAGSPKADYYWEKIVTLSKKLDNLLDRYSYYWSMNNYYLNHMPAPDYEKALVANDSLIKFAKVIAPANLPGLYNVQSQTYEVMGKYKEALDYLKVAYHGKDSLASETVHKQLSELQVKYNLKELNSQNAELELRNKHILLACLSFFLLIAVGICFYLYRNLKKEKAMKLHLCKLKEKAEESEKMKRAFVNSICHEIRTPLNAIVGFSDLIFNTDVDEEMRSTFPEEIQKNASLLTSLINGMLEVANLDVSQERLDCQPTDIKQICYHETDLLKEYLKPTIRYRLELPEEQVIVSTHEKYLSLVIQHLLENANKFTEEGEITLGCLLNEKEKKLTLTVADTGCGIPQNMHHKVFERFSKLNEFTPGNGLGLYLCKLIVTRLAGDIRIDPGYTEGTRFIVTLPV